MTFFILKQGKDLENQEVEPHQKFPRSTPFRSSGAGCKSCHQNNRVEYNVDRVEYNVDDSNFGYYSSIIE